MLDTKDMKYYFIHIIKTGGTSVRNFLFKHFGSKCFNAYQLYNEDFLSQEAVKYIENAYNYDIYTDHRLSMVATEKSNAISIAIVRDPVERFISSYKFFSKIKNINYPFKYIEQAIQELLINRNRNHKGVSQVYHLSENYGFNYIKEEIKKPNNIIIPYEYINDIPKIFNINDKLPVENKTEKIDFGSNITNKIKSLSEEEYRLHQLILENYKK